MSLRITAVGPQTLVEDLGRPGHAGLGVTASGAFASRAEATWRRNARATSSSVAMSASVNWVFWKSAMARPKARRSCT